MSTPTTPQGVTSTGYVFLGTALCLVGFAITFAGVLGSDGFDAASPTGVLGCIVGVAGSALLLVGVIAKGVALGMEEHRRSR
ncbi:hypothetical protein [Solicola gregarius]|uniref:Uncharacterized protein n=1 Tax=Solicola gregarius TaxID=2908642 RepID=A0AA46TL23_9ACTN|nr:hypothetical protein [Solicola gregarius]UYM07251.1 hypothetical protein L0C25_09305 [Solicola gregarius]